MPTPGVPGNGWRKGQQERWETKMSAHANRLLEQEAEIESLRAELHDALQVASVEASERRRAHADRDALVAALSHLADKEQEYRLIHDGKGDAHIDTGRAWDRLRKAGNAARTILAQIKERKT